ncbi:hypothetical protein [Streptomyces griseorubiginosus]|uniref:hypothetical protein n=1 Tax=Streptomyces griseorubiginosus TaxID=67304 RepID=UPI0036E05692
MRLRLTLATTFAALALTACTSTDQPAPAETITVEATTPDPTPTLDDDMTQLVVDLSWEQQTEDDKDAMCQGIALYGPDWAAEQMQQGAGDSVVDWDRAAELVEQKCAER